MEMTGRGGGRLGPPRMLGVRHVFGIVSVHNLPIYDANRAARHHHADRGKARAESPRTPPDVAARALLGELGVVIASTGPGSDQHHDGPVRVAGRR